MLLLGTAQLSAGCVDIGAECATHGGSDASLFERSGKGLYCLAARSRKAGLRYGIDGDEIDVNGERGAVGAKRRVQQSGKPRRRLGGIVLACDQRIFKGNASACGEIVATAGIQQGGDAPFAVDGHDGTSGFVIRCVERNRKGNRKLFLSEPIDPVAQTAG